MSDTDSELAKYNKDPRVPCKYGNTCYQRNPDHHKKYKHPPMNKNKQGTHHVNKKMKIERDDKRATKVAISNDVSESDDSNFEDNSDTSSKNNQISDTESDRNGSLANNGTLSNKENQKETSKKQKVHVSNNVSDSGESDSDEKGPVGKDKSRNECERSKTEEKPSTGDLDYKQFIKHKFLVDMPKDFYQFWDYCKRIKPNNPLETLKDVGLRLVGPFDVLAGKFENVKKSDEQYLLHWRYYHDPPEFQTVLKGSEKTGYHIGYFRDSPDEPPVFLASNGAKKDGVLQEMGGNIFTSVIMYLEDLKKTGDPFQKMQIGRVLASITKEAANLKLDLSHRTDKMISRQKKIVTRSFNKIGLVVPIDRRTQVGYRELAFGNKDLATLFTQLQNALPEQKPKYLSQLQPVFTFASIAADECDFGTGIELGWNIISHGVDSLNSTALRFLATSYRLLNREVFAKIAEAHMNNRKKGCDLSII